MTDRGISSGEEFLTAAAKAYFASAFQSSSFQIGTEIDKALNWIPTFNLKYSIIKPYWEKFLTIPIRLSSVLEDLM